jgi:glycosyltransferase involved in cell wall biosynthesis
VRILHVSTRLILGGSQENTVLSCEGQSRRGHEVHLAFGPIYGPEGSMLARVQAFNRACESGAERARPIGLHEVPDLVRELSLRRDLRAHAQLGALIRRLEPDVVHTHSSKAGVLGRWAAWGARGLVAPRAVASGASVSGAERERGHRALGVVHTIHGPPFMPVEPGAGVRAVLGRLKTRATNAIYTFAERSAARHCHAIVSVADAMTAQFLARQIGTPELYTTVRSGMEVDTFLHARDNETRDASRRALGLAPEHFVVGTVARLAQHKGHDDLLDALAPELADNLRRPDRAHWRLLWVGDGWWRQRLLARVEALGLRDRVIVTGLVPPERVPAMIRAMDVLAHPSSREGLPRTVPQALLCGVPCVAYDADGTREVCVDALADPSRATGRLVPVGDIAALREAIVWMHDHPDQRAALGARGRERCAREFSVDAMLDGLDRVYARALASASAGRC